MSTNEEKKLDEFTRKMVTEAGLERPSSSFLQNVMKQVETLKTPAFISKPLLPTWLWYFLGAAGALLVAIFYNSGTPSGSDVWNLDFLSSFQMKPINLSANLMAIIISALLMIMLEVYLVRQWHQKRMDKLSR